MATTAQFTAQPIIDIAQVSTANTNRDGTGTLVTVASGPSASAGAGIGKRINRVTVTATGNVTTGVVRFFVSTDNGTTNYLILERLVPTITPSSSTAVYRTDVSELVGLVLVGGGNCLLRASTNNSQTFNICVESGLL